MAPAPPAEIDGNVVKGTHHGHYFVKMFGEQHNNSVFYFTCSRLSREKLIEIPKFFLKCLVSRFPPCDPSQLINRVFQSTWFLVRSKGTRMGHHRQPEIIAQQYDDVFTEWMAK